MKLGRFVEFRAWEGPGPAAPVPVALAEFTPPSRAAAEPGRVRAVLAGLVPAQLAEAVRIPADPVDYVALAAALAVALHDPDDTCGLYSGVAWTAAGRARIVLGYHDVQTALHALRAALEIANAAFARLAGDPDPRRAIRALVERTEAVMALRQPDPAARALMRAAARRGMPVYPLSPGSRIWLYGQGSAGLQCLEAANQRDAMTGARLAADKLLSNQLVCRLGLPGVEHGVARDLETARTLARQFGYPLVVKPIDRGKGRGVTAGVRTPEALQEAFRRAERYSTRGVLIERFVAGDDHRLSVFGGRLCFASRRAPPRVTGDGLRTVAELIEEENGRRGTQAVASGFIHRIEIDADLRGVLADQGLALEDRPAAGRVVMLRVIANVATGGTVTDCTGSIHPDNRLLAETIARAFHMDALGIDFMTPDITRSWREVPCAVLEVNATPGFSSDERADRIIAASFPDGADGRIPTVVFVGAPRDALDQTARVLAGAALKVGSTDGSVTLFDGQPRCRAGDGLPARVLALILDPACDALVVGTTTAALERHGFPLDRCDLLVFAHEADADTPSGAVARRCAARVRVCAPGEDAAAAARPLLADVLRRVGRR